jgi:hypothetical protein
MPVTLAWADPLRLGHVPLAATVLDEATGETVEIDATLRVVVHCGPRPRVHAVVVRQRAVGASGRNYVLAGADRAPLDGVCVDTLLRPVMTFDLAPRRPTRADACARRSCRIPVDVMLDLRFDAQGGLTAAESHSADAPSPTAERALATALEFLGTPFQWGGSTPETGFDAPGLVQYAYAQAGVALPRVTESQFLVGAIVPREDLLPGDLIFFRDATGDVHHVGMSLGGDQFVHAPHTGDVVKISTLTEPFYAAQFAGGRRVA